MTFPLTLYLAFGCQNRTRPESWPGFAPENASRLEAAAQPGAVIVFDADGTLWKGDVGEAFFLWQLKENLFLPPRAESARKNWQMYQEGKLPEREMWIEATRAQAGVEETVLRQRAKEFFEKSFMGEVFPAMKAAISKFQAGGSEVWIVSASHRWIVEPGAAYLRIPADHVVAISTVVRDGRVTDEIIEPVPFKEGKVDAIQKYIRKTPAVVFGNSMSDAPMMRLSTSTAVAINPNDELRALALEKKWAVQLLE